MEISEFSVRNKTSEFSDRNNFSSYITQFKQRNKAPVSVGGYYKVLKSFARGYRQDL